MSDTPFRFDDGVAYERQMGRWSRLAGEVFLDWLALPPGLAWLDIGCGNGAFTEVVAARCAPASLDAIDPSAAQLDHARAQPAAARIRYRQGDAMALPWADDAFDVAMMALVVFFVPDPAKAVAEAARVTRPGGTVAAYAWDMHGGGFPYAALVALLRDIGRNAPKPPSVDASKLDALRELWQRAGIDGVETRQIAVQRTYASFEDLWDTARSNASLRALVDGLSPAEAGALRARLRERLPAAADGTITHGARANAVKGRMPS